VPDWKQKWEKTLEAAKKEGPVSIYGSQAFDFLLREFHRKYPESKVIFVGGRGSQLGPRIMAERRAGKHLADMFLMGSGTPYRELLPGIPFALP